MQRGARSCYQSSMEVSSIYLMYTTASLYRQTAPACNAFYCYRKIDWFHSATNFVSPNLSKSSTTHSSHLFLPVPIHLLYILKCINFFAFVIYTTEFQPFVCY